MSPPAPGAKSPRTSLGSAAAIIAPNTHIRNQLNVREEEYLSDSTDARVNSFHDTLAPAPRLPRTPRSSRGANTRERIVEAAAAAFDERGYLGVNLNDVVVRLGLTKGALYYFFPTKEDLALEIVSRHFSAWGPMADEVFSAHTNKLDALVAITYRVGRSYQVDPIARAGSRLSTERNLISATLPEPFVGWSEVLTRWLKSARARRQLRPGVQPAAVAQVIVAFFYGSQAISREFDQDRSDLIVRLDRFWTILLPTLRPD